MMGPKSLFKKEELVRSAENAAEKSKYCEKSERSYTLALAHLKKYARGTSAREKSRRVLGEAKHSDGDESHFLSARSDSRKPARSEDDSFVRRRVPLTYKLVGSLLLIIRGKPIGHRYGPSAPFPSQTRVYRIGINGLSRRRTNTCVCTLFPMGLVGSRNATSCFPSVPSGPAFLYSHKFAWQESLSRFPLVARNQPASSPPVVSPSHRRGKREAKGSRRVKKDKDEKGGNKLEASELGSQLYGNEDVDENDDDARSI